MSEALQRGDALSLLADLHRTLDALQTVDLTSGTDDATVSALREFERFRRRLETVDHALILDAEQRGLPGHTLARGPAPWLRQVLVLDVHEANARVRAAHAAGTPRAFTGDALAPRYAAVAAAQARGDLSARQAAVITGTLERVRDVAVEHLPAAETRLVEFARQFDPTALQKLAQRERDWLDPDGTLPEVERRRRDRTFRLTQRPDGSCTGSFDATAQLGELLQTVFDALAAPHTDPGGVHDTRTPGQRRHDALLDALAAAVRAGTLPTAGGVLTTVVLTLDAEDYLTGTGFATTGHGALVPTTEALSWAGGDHRLMITALGSTRAITHYGFTHRFFTEGQRLALIARDQGCCFPGCDAPPGWCQAAHIIDHADGGPTRVDNGMLLCGHHHREYPRAGWTPSLLDGRPAWTPPAWIDPARTPIRT